MKKILYSAFIVLLCQSSVFASSAAAKASKRSAPKKSNVELFAELAQELRNTNFQVKPSSTRGLHVSARLKTLATEYSHLLCVTWASLHSSSLAPYPLMCHHSTPLLLALNDVTCNVVKHHDVLLFLLGLPNAPKFVNIPMSFTEVDLDDVIPTVLERALTLPRPDALLVSLLQSGADVSLLGLTATQIIDHKSRDKHVGSISEENLTRLSDAAGKTSKKDSINTALAKLTIILSEDERKKQ